MNAALGLRLAAAFFAGFFAAVFFAALAGFLAAGFFAAVFFAGFLAGFLAAVFFAAFLAVAMGLLPVVLVRAVVADRPEALPSCRGIEASSRPTIPHFPEE